MKLVLYTKPIPVNQRTMIVGRHQSSSKKWKDTKAALHEEIASQANFEPLEGYVAATIHFYYGDNRKRDVDAYIKIILDAGEGLLYNNDSQVIELHAFKHYDKENPRTEIELTRAV